MACKGSAVRIRYAPPLLFLKSCESKAFKMAFLGTKVGTNPLGTLLVFIVSISLDPTKCSLPFGQPSSRSLGHSKHFQVVQDTSCLQSGKALIVVTHSTIDRRNAFDQKFSHWTRANTSAARRLFACHVCPSRGLVERKTRVFCVPTTSDSAPGDLDQTTL